MLDVGEDLKSVISRQTMKVCKKLGIMLCFFFINFKLYQNGCSIVIFVSADFVSAPFHTDKIQIYESYDQPEVFFRPAIRCFLVGN